MIPVLERTAYNAVTSAMRVLNEARFMELTRGDATPPHVCASVSREFSARCTTEQVSALLAPWIALTGMASCSSLIVTCDPVQGTAVHFMVRGQL